MALGRLLWSSLGCVIVGVLCVKGGGVGLNAPTLSLSVKELPPSTSKRNEVAIRQLYDVLFKGVPLTLTGTQGVFFPAVKTICLGLALHSRVGP